jgi:hypothetical protein
VSDGDFFARVIAALERTRIPYMVTGSLASSAYGRVRSTRDIDVVIAPTEWQLTAFVGEFDNDRYYADGDDAIDALRRRSQFNIIDFASSWKADLIIRKERPFNRKEFERRRDYEIGGMTVSLTSPEDILIAKLEWAKMGESERQIDDAAGIIEIQGEALDSAYIEHWVAELELTAQWAAALQRASGWNPTRRAGT